LSGIFVANGKKTKKAKDKKTSVKHIRIRLIGGCVNKSSDGMELSVSTHKDLDLTFWVPI